MCSTASQHEVLSLVSTELSCIILLSKTTDEELECTLSITPQGCHRSAPLSCIILSKTTDEEMECTHSQHQALTQVSTAELDLVVQDVFAHLGSHLALAADHRLFGVTACVHRRDGEDS